MPKNYQFSKNGMVPTIQREPDFSRTCGFHQVLDNAELMMYMKFQRNLMIGCRDMGKKHKKCPQNRVFHHLRPPKIFFKNRALSIFYPNFMQKCPEKLCEVIASSNTIPAKQKRLHQGIIDKVITLVGEKRRIKK